MFKIKTITILATVIMLLHVFIIRYSLWKNYPESNFAPATRSARALGVKISPVAGTCSLECEKKKRGVVMVIFGNHITTRTKEKFENSDLY